MDDAKGDGFFLFHRRVLDPVGLGMLGESHVQSDVVMGFEELLGVWEAIQEVGPCNHPSYLRNRLLPKLVYSALVVLGFLDAAPVDLEDLDDRDRLILESRIDHEGGAEVTSLLVEILLIII